MKKMFLDMDGVIVDIHTHVYKEYGIHRQQIDAFPRPLPWDFLDRIIGRSVWKELDARFWATAPLCPWAKELVAIVERVFGDMVCVLSAHSGSSAAIDGKVACLTIHFPQFAAPKKHLFGEGKFFCAGPGKFLIDDSDKHVQDFCDHGGSGILFPREWNSQHDRDGLTKIRGLL